MIINKNAIQKTVLFVLLLILIVGVVLYIFSRSSIETGEERYWLLDVTTMAFFALAFLSIIYWCISVEFKVSLGLFVLGFCMALLLSSGSISFADRINEKPEKYKRMLPTTLALEKSYMRIFRTEPYRLDRLKQKISEWGDLIE